MDGDERVAMVEIMRRNYQSLRASRNGQYLVVKKISAAQLENFLFIMVHFILAFLFCHSEVDHRGMT